MTLKVQGLTKSYGETKAVQQVNFSLQQGRVLGLLGRNGAGKTTTIKLLLGLLQPDSGSMTWNGRPLRREEVSIGYLPEERGLYAKTKITDQLRYFGQLEGMTRKEADAAIEYWLTKLEMTEYRNKKAGELSKGNQQKIQIIATLLHNPEIVILDEPFSGLDPVNASVLANLISEQIQAGKTVIFSSHRMEQVEAFCEEIVLLHRGQMVLSGTLTEIKQTYGYRTLTLPGTAEVRKALGDLGRAFEERGHDAAVRVQHDEEALHLLGQLREKGLRFRYFQMLEPTLQEIFVERAR
ncbi:ABC transporter ATP-binding protein [Ectobacillus ponti]|uniref:ATP-binding cassette domain-containing protein n=1 Tax=Ectobacillus ponti TaxID=2961894 RepID=A0AA41X5U9_9BACI|nr:ATP-binding cassette domain-containing protein [Ectobacillus ponti]MCP8967204.1 ATP-binding cassette domain-containing protein [Ectobacillus ponti]